MCKYLARPEYWILNRLTRCLYRLAALLERRNQRSCAIYPQYGALEAKYCPQKVEQSCQWWMTKNGIFRQSLFGLTPYISYRSDSFPGAYRAEISSRHLAE